MEGINSADWFYAHEAVKAGQKARGLADIFGVGHPPWMDVQYVRQYMNFQVGIGRMNPNPVHMPLPTNEPEPDDGRITFRGLNDYIYTADDGTRNTYRFGTAHDGEIIREAPRRGWITFAGNNTTVTTRPLTQAEPPPPPDDHVDPAFLDNLLRSIRERLTGHEDEH